MSIEEGPYRSAPISPRPIPAQFDAHQRFWLRVLTVSVVGAASTILGVAYMIYYH